jgi:hypothetical protein
VEGPVMNVNQDTIQEVKVEVSNYSAAYGRDVGQISVTSKSGTNALHGTVYDSFQNSGLNANDPYSNHQGFGRNAYHQNQYGFTVGGPVFIPKVFNGKNKMFFFGSFERLRNRGLSTFATYVPTPAERTGDFSAWLTRFPVNPVSCDGSSSAPANCRFVIYDPTTYDPNTGLRQPFSNNVISNPSPIALAYLSHFPQPTGYVSPDPNNFDNWSGTNTAGINNDNYTARIDYDLTNRDVLYFRYLRDTGSKINEGGLIPSLALGDGPVHRVNTYQVHYVHSFTSTLTNELNVSWTSAYNWSNQSAQVNKFMQATWLPSLFQNTSTGGAGFTSYDLGLLNIKNDATFSVNIGFPGDFGSGLSLGATEYWYQAVPIFQFSDNLSKVIRQHTLKAGFYWSRRHERDNDVIRSMNVQGGYTSKGPNIGDGSGFNRLAEFETGFVSSMDQRSPLTGGDGSLYFAMPEYSGYLNDSWNVTPRLTMNLGVRYDVALPASSVNNYWGVLDTTYPGYRMVMPGLTPGTHNPPFPADKNNFAPRLGFAYRTGDKTVVRGGYGMFYETGRYKYLDQMFFNSPGYGGSPYNSAVQVPDPAETFYTLNDVFPAAVSINKGTWPVPLGIDGGLLGLRSDTRTVDSKSAIAPYIQRWSLDVQRELGKAVVATLGYVGSKGTKLITQYDLNAPPQGTYLNSDAFYQARPLTAAAPGRWESIWAVHPNRSNNYHALNAQLTTRGWHGVTSQVSYTWSKQMDNYFGEGGEGGPRALGGQWHPEWSYGPSDANHTNRFVAAFTYELPGKALGNRFLREAVGAWQINSIATFESGAPTTVWNGYTSSYDYMGDVPLQTCKGNLARGSRTFTHYFNTNCYTEPAASTDPTLISQGITNFALTRGNERRNNLRQPGINNWDLGLQKSFRVFGEGRELQFRADSFNAFNHTQWSSIDTFDDRQVNAQSQFGYITGGRAGRHMQLNMKFVF